MTVRRDERVLEGKSMLWRGWQKLGARVLEGGAHEGLVMERLVMTH